MFGNLATAALRPDLNDNIVLMLRLDFPVDLPERVDRITLFGGTSTEHLSRTRARHAVLCNENYRQNLIDNYYVDEARMLL